MPVILALGILRQEDYKFETSLGYIVRSSYKRGEKSIVGAPKEGWFSVMKVDFGFRR